MFSVYTWDMIKNIKFKLPVHGYVGFGLWCFEVTDVAKNGYIYNAAANVVSLQCE